jgi:hypothetical protein
VQQDLQEQTAQMVPLDPQEPLGLLAQAVVENFQCFYYQECKKWQQHIKY